MIANDIFCKGRPKDKNGDSCVSWNLNTTTGLWEPPIPKPEYTREQIEEFKHYFWDESKYVVDSTAGWVLIP